jgi:hypothetical protein
MCSTVRCPECEKVTWAGCGMHIEQALAGYSSEQICRCDEAIAATTQKTEVPK